MAIYSIPRLFVCLRMRMSTLKQHWSVRGPLRECRLIWSGASGLPYYCAPLVCVSAVLESLAVWQHNKPKTKNHRVEGMEAKLKRKKQDFLIHNPKKNLAQVAGIAQTHRAGMGHSVGRFCRHHWSTLINCNSNLSMCGIFLSRLLPPPDIRVLLPTPKETKEDNSNIWSFRIPTGIGCTKVRGSQRIFRDSSITLAQWWRARHLINLVIRRSQVRFRPKTRQLRFTWIWANRPSSKGSKLLFPVIKAT